MPHVLTIARIRAIMKAHYALGGKEMTIIRRIKAVTSAILALTLLVGMLSVGGVTVSASSSKTLALNGSLLSQVGAQPAYSYSCSCFALAYARTILDGKVHHYSEYNEYGADHYTVNCQWSWGGYYSVSAGSRTAVFQACLDSINANTPIILHVYSEYGQHWVTVVGYQNVTSAATMSESNLLIIDPGWGYSGGTPCTLTNGNVSYSLYSDYRYVRTDYAAASYNTVSIPHANYTIWNDSTGSHLVVEGSVDVSQQNIAVHPMTGESGMKFEIIEESNGHRIRPHCTTTKVVNVYADAVSSGSNVNLFANTPNDTTQRWLFELVREDYYNYYIIRNAQNPSCVLTQDGANCIVATYTGGANQIWGLCPVEDEPPVISDVQIGDITSEGYTISCTVTDNDSVRRVRFPTWTTINGQDELVWADGAKSGTTVTFRVNRSDHNNEYGEYCTDIYAYDASGTEAKLRVIVMVDGSGAVITEPVPEEDPYLTVTIETVEHAGTIKTGEEITLDLTASAVEDITALDMRLCFDDTKFAFVSGEFKGTLGSFDIKSFNGSPAAAETDGAEVWLTAAKTSGGAALNDGEVIASVTLRALTDITADEAVRAYRCDVTSAASLVGGYELTAAWVDGGVVITEYPNGDINRDGRVSLTDAMRAFYAVNGQIVLDVEEAALADVNDDGEVDIQDAMRIFYCVNGVIDSL